MANELKPCPFCNSTDVSVNRMEKACMSWVSCKSCGLDAPSETGVTGEQATSYWNTRPAAPVAGLETIGYVHRGTAGLLMEGAVSKAVLVPKPGGDFKHPVVFGEQAEAIIATKDATLQDAIDCVKVLTDEKNKLEADNAALTARVKELTTVLDQQLGTPCEQIAHSEEVKALETQLAAARKALGYIANPLKAMQEAAEKAGAKIDGSVAYSLSNDASYLKGVARAALEAKP